MRGIVVGRCNKSGPALKSVAVGQRGLIEDAPIDGADRANSNAQSSPGFSNCWRGARILGSAVSRTSSPDFAAGLDWPRKLHGGRRVSQAYSVGGFSVSRHLRAGHNVRYPGAQHAL